MDLLSVAVRTLIHSIISRFSRVLFQCHFMIIVLPGIHCQGILLYGVCSLKMHFIFNFMVIKAVETKQKTMIVITSID